VFFAPNCPQLDITKSDTADISTWPIGDGVPGVAGAPVAFAQSIATWMRVSVSSDQTKEAGHFRRDEE
jgi:hypothetical protein